MKGIKTMKLTVISLIGQCGYFSCSICGLKLFKIIFYNENSDIWYCANCLIKELNKTEIINTKNKTLKEYTKDNPNFYYINKKEYYKDY